MLRYEYFQIYYNTFKTRKNIPRLKYSLADRVLLFVFSREHNQQSVVVFEREIADSIVEICLGRLKEKTLSCYLNARNKI